MGYKQGVREDADNMELEDARQDLAADQVLRVDDYEEIAENVKDNCEELFCCGSLDDCRECYGAKQR